MRRGRRAAVLLAVALAGSPGAASADVPPVPGTVEAWLEAEGPTAVATSETSFLPVEDLVAAVIGGATSVHVWSQDYAAGDTWEDAVVPSDEWVAPVLLEGAGVGAIVVAESDGSIVDHRLVWDPDLGADLAAFQATTFILDDASGGWFRLGGDILTPVTGEARDVLAGSIDIGAYQPFLVARLGGGGEEPAVPAEPGGMERLLPVAVAAGVLAGLLVIVGVVVWVRRPEDLED